MPLRPPPRFGSGDEMLFATARFQSLGRFASGLFRFSPCFAHVTPKIQPQFAPAPVPVAQVAELRRHGFILTVFGFVAHLIFHVVVRRTKLTPRLFSVSSWLDSGIFPAHTRPQSHGETNQREKEAHRAVRPQGQEAEK